MTALPAAWAQDCYVNCDGSTLAPILNFADVVCFMSEFAAGDLRANCDLSTTPPILNVNDFVCFLDSFTSGCPDSSPVVNGGRAREFLRRSSYQRIALVRLGDSNQLFGNHGWDHGFQKALADRCGLYATPLFSHNENDGLGAGIGYKCVAITAGHDVGEVHGPGSFFYNQEAWGDAGAPVPAIFHRPSFVSAVVPAYVNTGIEIDPDWPGNASSHLRYSVWVGRFQTPGGSFRPGWRNDATGIPLHMHGSGSWATGPDPQESIVRVDDDIPAAPRSFPLKAAPAIAGQGDIVGPWLGVYQCVSSVEMTRGGSEHTLVSAGGQGLWHYGTALQASPDASIARFFRCVGQLMAMQSQPRTVVVLIDSGLNDRNTPQMSLGPSPAPSNTAAGYVDNVRMLINRIRGVLLADGWTDAELCFVVSVSHPQDDDPESSEEAPLVRFRAALEAMARTDGDLASLNLARLTSAAELESLGYYDPLGRAHLTQPAYEDLARRELNALMR